MKSFTQKLGILLVIYAALLLLAGCAQKKKDSFRMITIAAENKSALLNYRTLAFIVYSVDSGKFTTMIVKNGDLLVVDKSDFALMIDEAMPDTITLAWDNNGLRVNNKWYGIGIENNTKSTEWIQTLRDEDLKSLSFIYIFNSISESQKPFFQRLATLNPTVGIFVDERAHGQTMKESLKSFSPKFLMMPLDSGVEVSGLFSGDLNHLEMLLLSSEKGPILGSLPKTPSLTSVFVASDSTLDENFFINNPQIERLTLLSPSEKTPFPSSISSLVELKELYIMSDSNGTYIFSQHHPMLQTLGVMIPKLDTATMAGLDHLRSLSIGISSDKTLRPYISPLPALENLSIYSDCDTLDYSALKNLSRLKYLSIGGEIGRDTTLYEFKNLKYLSVPDNFLKDSTRANALRAALPNVIITPNSGVCMGSGWLLVLLPFIGVYYFYQRRINQRPFHQDSI